MSIIRKPEPRETYGVGFLYHYVPNYQDFARRLEEVGGKVDIYEFLGVQFNCDPFELARFTKNLGKPVIAAINGFALGGGCETAMACTIRVAKVGSMPSAASPLKMKLLRELKVLKF